MNLYEDSPMYRLDQVGSKGLSNVELLALSMGGEQYMALAYQILQSTEGLRGLMTSSTHKLQQIEGIGPKRAAQLVAMMELARRFQSEYAIRSGQIGAPEDAAAMLMPSMRYLDQEQFWVMCLNTRSQVIVTQVLYQGSLNSSVVRVAEVFKLAIERSAAHIIVAHNHPSGDPSPSPEDIRVTRELVKAGKLLNIECRDHIIIGDNRFVSLRREHLMDTF